MAHTILMHRLWPILLLAGVAMIAPIRSAAQAHSKRLILKDGNYQPATKWEIHGNRVRYYSAEREEWEEVPNSLVDWAATNKYNQQLEADAASDALPHLTPEEEAERAAEAAKTPLVQPGVRLPDSGGVYLLDEYKGKPELVELAQAAGDLHKNTGRNILRAAINPLATSRQTIELTGASARIQAHGAQPAIFIDVLQGDDNDASDQASGSSHTSNPPAASSQKGSTESVAIPPAEDRFRLVRLQRKKNARIVGSLKVAFYGKVSQEESWIPAKISPVTSEWVKITPEKPLAPGEYALVELLGKKQINLYVWDFGVNPAAPENPPVWTAAEPKPAPTGTTASPVLEERPHF